MLSYQGVTLKALPLMPVPDGAVTAMGPVVAKPGTLVTIVVLVEPVTTALAPLNVTLLRDGVVLKFEPWIVTGVCRLAEPLAGVNPVTVTVDEVLLVIEVRFPTAS